MVMPPRPDMSAAHQAVMAPPEGALPSSRPDGMTPRALAHQALQTRSTFYQAQRLSDRQFYRRTFAVLGLVLVTGLLLSVIWFASEVFLVLFGGILVAVLLRAPTNWMRKYSVLSETMALALSISMLVGLIGMLIYLFTVPLAEQLVQLVTTLPRALLRLQQWARENSWSKPLHPLFAEFARFKLNFQLLSQATGILSSTATALGGLGVALFIGIYLSAQPRLYQRGFMHLLPPKFRRRAREVLDEAGVTLRFWLLGRLITMTVVGLCAGIGLWWLGVPLAFTLGILSGLLEFIPYLGPILAAVPALLIAFNIDPTQAFYVLLLYIGIQSAENYLLSPLIEQRTVALPPALVVFSTTLMGVLAGPLGVVLASPLTATSLVVVKLLYVEDVVEQPKSVSPES